jgi:phosphoenolpyruvate synthase/pyruvate phosphate dikinase
LVVEASEVTYTEARRSAKRGEPVNRPQSSVAGVAGMGIDGVSIGSNDLTQLMLGVDRDSDVCAELFDEADPAVLEAVAQIIEKANLLGITSSLCGQAPSTNRAFAEHLVRLGIIGFG